MNMRLISAQLLQMSLTQQHRGAPPGSSCNVASTPSPVVRQPKHPPKFSAIPFAVLRIQTTGTITTTWTRPRLPSSHILLILPRDAFRPSTATTKLQLASKNSYSLATASPGRVSRILLPPLIRNSGDRLQHPSQSDRRVPSGRGGSGTGRDGTDKTDKTGSRRNDRFQMLFPTDLRGGSGTVCKAGRSIARLGTLHPHGERLQLQA